MASEEELASDFARLVEESLAKPETSPTRFSSVRSWLATLIGAVPDQVNVSYISRGSANFRNRFGQRGFKEATALGVGILDEPAHRDSAVSFVREWLLEGLLVGPVAIGLRNPEGQWTLSDLVEIVPTPGVTSLVRVFPAIQVVTVEPPSRSVDYAPSVQGGLWMEITGNEIGERLIAPRSQDHWSYPLMTQVASGDFVVHYSTQRQAIVGISRAAGPAVESELEWPSASTGGQARPQPAWSVPLVGYRELSPPVTLADLRSKSTEIRSIHERLQKEKGDPLYFPFEVSSRRELRPQQAYLTRFPSEIAELFDQLHELRSTRLNTVVAERQPEETMEDLAERLFLPVGFLDRIRKLLLHKNQVIFYGPPGTGKTYVARQLARHMAREENAVVLVQFHPSYSYEDFVEGFRPSQAEAEGRFVLRDGPLKKIAVRASGSPNDPAFLLIDEINRGNVAKIFGELYFLLEYRGEKAQLLYSDEAFTLPKNLLIIGTMNTADRSIALVDAALRRRFHFVGFFPDEPPISRVLALWLDRNKPELKWVAELVRLANEKVGGRVGLIGPSHFLREDLSEEWVELIWQHSVMPYLEEQFFGDEPRLKGFEFARLKAEAKSLVSGAPAPDGSTTQS